EQTGTISQTGVTTFGLNIDSLQTVHALESGTSHGVTSVEVTSANPGFDASRSTALPAYYLGEYAAAGNSVREEFQAAEGTVNLEHDASSAAGPQEYRTESYRRLINTGTDEAGFPRTAHTWGSALESGVQTWTTADDTVTGSGQFASASGFVAGHAG